MADKIAKILSKLPLKQLSMIEAAITNIMSGNLTGLDIRSLKGRPGLYRVRVGDYRIIFMNGPETGFVITSIAKRDERTYKNV